MSRDRRRMVFHLMGPFFKDHQVLTAPRLQQPPYANSTSHSPWLCLQQDKAQCAVLHLCRVVLLHTAGDLVVLAWEMSRSHRSQFRPEPVQESHPLPAPVLQVMATAVLLVTCGAAEARDSTVVSTASGRYALRQLFLKYNTVDVVAEAGRHLPLHQRRKHQTVHNFHQCQPMRSLLHTCLIVLLSIATVITGSTHLIQPPTLITPPIPNNPPQARFKRQVSLMPSPRLWLVNGCLSTSADASPLACLTRPWSTILPMASATSVGSGLHRTKEPSCGAVNSQPPDRLLWARVAAN